MRALEETTTRHPRIQRKAAPRALSQKRSNRSLPRTRKLSSTVYSNVSKRAAPSPSTGDRRPILLSMQVSTYSTRQVIYTLPKTKQLTINNLSVINLPPCGPSASATARFSLNSAVYQRRSIHSLYTSTQLMCALRQHPAFVHLPTTLPSIVHFSLITSTLLSPTQPTQEQHWAIPSH